MLKLEPLLRFSNPVTVQPIGHTQFGERTTYIVGEGVFSGPKLNGRILTGGDAQFGDTLFMAQVQFETGDPRNAWLNEPLAVAEARETAASVEYQLCALEHDRQTAT